MSTSNSLPTKIFPVRKEHTYDGVLTTFVAVGNGKTVVISQIEDQPLCINVYAAEFAGMNDWEGKKPVQSLEFDQTIPKGDELKSLAERYLAG